MMEPRLLIGETLAHYRITAHLGTGGMGEVYRATDTKLGREVALKLLPATLTRDLERVARFEREARMLALLQHPNVASIYGFEDTGTHRFLVMELVEGADLAERLRQSPLALDEALGVARQITLGLEAAHEKGIVHRDLKPGNIKLGADGTVKILDFGLAAAVADEAGTQDLERSPTITAAMTQAGVVLGTAAYMSPEQARGKPVDRRTDIWAFGCVLYEMLTGSKVFGGETVSDVIARILERTPDLDKLPATLPPGLRRLVRRCLAKDPDTRLRDIADARLELDEAGSDTPLATTLLPSGRHRLAWIPWSVAVVLAVVLAWALRPGSAPTPEVTQFDIEPPAGASFGEFMLSPDGRMLAFVATQNLDDTQLWIHRFDADEPELLPGTDNASFPFWSPDSKSIGFFSNGKLRRVDLATKTTQTLADAPNGRGADWSDDDVILFTPEGMDALYTVPAGGGAVKQLTEIVADSIPGQWSHRMPHFLPGSREFTYVTQDGALKVTQSFLASLDTPQDTKPLLSELSEVAAPPGYLLFVRGATLIAQPFDAKRREFSGSAYPLAKGISNSYPRTGRASFSVSDTGMLAYRSLERPSTELVWYDRRGERMETIAPADQHSDVDLSPDGRRLTFLRAQPTNDTRELWVRELDRGTSSRLASGRLSSPCWSPDGRSLYYVGDPSVYRQRVDRADSREPVLAPEENPGHGPDVILAVASRKNVLILQNWDSSTDSDLWMLETHAGARPKIVVKAPGYQGHPSISPDGKWVAYASNESGRFEVYLQNILDPNQKRVVSTQGGMAPAWNEDGSEVYYLSPHFDLTAVVVDLERGIVVGTPRRLFHSPPGVSDLFGTIELAPELVSCRGGRFLFNVTVDAAASRKITVVLNWPARAPSE